jgi:hypothetical protein
MSLRVFESTSVPHGTKLICVGVGVGVATGAGFVIATPLFQTSFVPDLMQVNFFPPAVAVDPALVHLAPALEAAA